MPQRVVPITMALKGFLLSYSHCLVAAMTSAGPISVAKNFLQESAVVLGWKPVMNSGLALVGEPLVSQT